MQQAAARPTRPPSEHGIEHLPDAAVPGLLQGLLTFLLDTPRAWPFDQIHGQVSMAQFGDKVRRDYFPGAGFWAPDPIMILTILHVGNAALLCHDSTSRVGRLRTLLLAISAWARHLSGCRAAAPELPPWLL